MKATNSGIPISQSFFPQDPTVSAYHVVFPLVKVSPEGEILSLLGTCFPIAAAGIYVTAAHNFGPFQDFWNEQRKDPLFRKKLRWNRDEMRVGILRFIGEANHTSWKLELVENMSMFVEHDIAILAVQNQSPINYPFLPIKENVSTGQQIRILGYPGSSNSYEEISDGKYEAHLALIEASGTIIELFPDGKDKVLSWYPCFEITAEICSGHSGGPAIDFSIPAVVGVNSRGMEGQPGTCAWIGKMLDERISMDGWKFQLNTKSSVKWIDLSLRDLSRMGIVKIL